MANRKPIYLDYCATTPCDPAVVEAMLPFLPPILAMLLRPVTGMAGKLPKLCR